MSRQPATMAPPDLFRKLPPPTICLLVAALASHSTAHILPRQTTTIPYRTLAVDPFPLPTPHPLLARQAPNTICGFVDADPSLPVTCGAGSHCVVDRAAGAVGCCPDGEACTTGVFTGCVDGDGRGRTEVDPYVFTCSGSDVCYENVFDGGLTQVGCGTDTGLAASVATAAEGASQLRFETVSLGVTASTSSTSSSTSTTERAPETSQDDEDAPESAGGVNQTGAIVGGTISGVAVLVALLGLGCYFWRKKTRNARTAGPLTMDTKYISPMSNNVAFTPVATSNENAETGFTPLPHPTRPAPAAGPSTLGASVEGSDAERAPLAAEFEDFSRGYGEALTNIREEDEGGTTGVGARASAGSQAGVETPLWQQDRRQSRNMMWM